MKKVLILALVFVLFFPILASSHVGSDGSPEWYIFVINNMDGLNGDIDEYDDKWCKNAGEKLGTDNSSTYIALISDSSANAIDHVWYTGKIINTKGYVVADSRKKLFSDSLTNKPRYDINGWRYTGYVWTGSDSSGKAITDNCNNWKSDSKKIIGGVGNTGIGNTNSKSWLYYPECSDDETPCDNSCDNELAIYCIEVPVGCHDNDGDGFYSNSKYPSRTFEICGTENDCYDDDDKSYPGAEDVCDFKDNDCDGVIDDDWTWYRDLDDDRRGNHDVSKCEEGYPDGWVRNSDDCDDDDENTYPGAPEVCDGLDNDCDGNDEHNDEIVHCEGDVCLWADVCGCPAGCISGKTCANGECIPCTDEDGDGFYLEGCGDDIDCDDSNVRVNPEATEICNGKDDNCIDGIDEDVKTRWYLDSDGDRFVVSSKLACTKPGYFYRLGSEVKGDDCDDSNKDVNPGENEKCNQIDDNCDGEIDYGYTPDGIMMNPEVNSWWYFDLDNDGYGDNTVLPLCVKPEDRTLYTPSRKLAKDYENPDCDDTNYNVRPNAPEICDGLDNDCDGEVDEGLSKETYYWDFDGDGRGFKGSDGFEWCADEKNGISVSTAVGDCDDTDPLRYYIYNSDGELDSDCFGNKMDCYGDSDTTLCDGIDNDCDRIVDEGCCGNGKITSGYEVCDCVGRNCISNIDGLDSWDMNWDKSVCNVYDSSFAPGGGKLGCRNGCMVFDTSECETQVCGNGLVEGNEVCDTKNFQSFSCNSLNSGYISGSVSCSDDCLSYDIGNCKLATCGNGKLDDGEQCEGSDFDGGTCEDYDYLGGGSLNCNSNNCQIEVTDCKSDCGNGFKEPGEVCDGTAVGGKTCTGANFAKGTVGCSNSCDTFDYSGCDKIVCGDGICSSGEDNYCLLDCSFEEKGSTNFRVLDSVCGDDKLGIYEQCDDTMLGGMTCEDFDFTGGVLKCTDTCGWDVSSCSYSGTVSVGRTEISKLIKEINSAIMEAKLQDKDTVAAETLLLQAIKDYAGDDPDYDAIEIELLKAGDLLGIEGGSVTIGDGESSPYLLGIVVLGLLLMMAFVLKGLGGKPKEEEN